MSTVNDLILENAYLDYLVKVGLKEEDMPQTQREMMREAFMAGATSVLVFLTQTVSNLPDEEGVYCIDEVLQQCTDFWNSKKIV